MATSHIVEGVEVCVGCISSYIKSESLDVDVIKSLTYATCDECGNEHDSHKITSKLKLVNLICKECD